MAVLVTAIHVFATNALAVTATGWRYAVRLLGQFGELVKTWAIRNGIASWPNSNAIISSTSGRPLRKRSARPPNRSGEVDAPSGLAPGKPAHYFRLTGKRRLPVRRPYRPSAVQHSEFSEEVCAWTKGPLQSLQTIFAPIFAVTA